MSYRQGFYLCNTSSPTVQQGDPCRISSMHLSLNSIVHFLVPNIPLTNVPLHSVLPHSASVTLISFMSLIYTVLFILAPILSICSSQNSKLNIFSNLFYSVPSSHMGSLALDTKTRFWIHKDLWFEHPH